MTLLSLIIVKTLLFGSLGYFIRASLAATRGFDVGQAGLLTISGYTFWLLSAYFESIYGLLFLSLAFLCLLSVLWHTTLNTLIRRVNSPAFILIGGIGFSGIVTGLLGFIFGPGTKSMAPGLISNLTSLELSLVFCSLSLLTTLLLRFSRIGIMLDMLDRDRSFAIEVGCSPSNFMPAYGLLIGFSLSLSGAANMLINGTSPDSGIHLFLIGAAVAITFQEFRMRNCMIAGLLFASIETLITYWISPSIAALPVFAFIFIAVTAKSFRREAI